MRLKYSVLVLALLGFVLVGGPALAQDTGIRDTVRVESNPNVAPGASFSVPINMYFDVVYNGVTIPLSYRKQGGGVPDVDMDTVDFSAGFGTTDINVANIDRTAQRMLISAIPLFSPPFNPRTGMDLFANIDFTAHVAAPQQIMEIDSTFFPPSNSLLMSSPAAPLGVVPMFFPGEICINGPCGAAGGPPVFDQASPVALSGDEGTTFGQLVSATDPDSDPITFTSPNMVPFGSLTDNSDGTASLSFSPGFADAGVYNGILVIASDATILAADDGEDTLVVNVTVIDVNRAPALAAVADVTMDEGTHADMPLSATDADSDPITLSGVGLPGFAVLTDNGNGTGNIAVDPTFADAGVYPISVIASDGTDADTQSATITVNDVNRKPTQVAIANPTLDEGTHLDIPLSSSDPDGDGLTYSVHNIQLFMTLTDNGDGTGNIAIDPGCATDGMYSILVIVTDDGTPNLADTQQVTVTVNDVPTDLVSDVPSLTFNHQLGAAPPPGQSFTISNNGCGEVAVDAASSSANLLVTPPSGTTPQLFTADIDTAGLTEGTFNETITISEPPPLEAGAAAQVVVNVTINVTSAANAAPVLDPVADVTMAEGANANMPLSSSDADGDALTLSTVNLPAFGALTDNGDGTGNIALAPGFDDAGVYPISVIVSDGTDADTQGATITVTDVNRDPTLVAIPDAVVDEGAHLDIPLAASDPDGDGLTFSLFNPQPFMTLTDNGDGTGNIAIDPGCAAAGEYPFAVWVTDDGSPNLVDIQPVILTVNDVPADLVSDVPSLTFNHQLGSPPPPSQHFTVSNNGCGEVAVNSASSSANLLVTPLSGTTPQLFAAGLDTAGLAEGTFNETITISEPPALTAGTAALVVVNVTINVTSTPNDAPVLAPVATVVMDEGTHGDVPLSASDPNSDPLSFSVDGLPGFAVLTDNGDGTGNIALDPGFSDAGVYPITVIVSDGSLADSQNTTITVNDVNHKPTQVAIADVTMNEGEHVDVPLSSSDPDGDGLTYSVHNLQAFMTLTDNGDGTGNISIDPGCSDAGAYGITVIVTDDGTPNLPDSQAVLVTIVDVPTDLVGTPANVTINYTVGDPPPPTEIVRVSNNGCGEVPVTAFATGNLIVSPLDGLTPQDFAIDLDTTGLSTGTHNETVTISEAPFLPAGQGPEVVINITIVVVQPVECVDSVIVEHRTVDGDVQDTAYVDVYWRNCAPSLGASLPLTWDPAVLSLDTVLWGSRVTVINARIANINNGSGAVLLGLIPVLEPPVAPGAGLFAKLCFSILDCATAPVAIDTMFFPPGGSYLFVDNNSQPVVPEFTAGSLTILGGQPEISVTPNALAYTFEEGSGSMTDCDTVSVSNIGCGDLLWSAATAAPWIAVDPMSGQGGDDAEICVDGSALPVGVHCDTVWFSEAPVAAAVIPLPGTPVEVCVTITAAPEPPVIWLDSTYYHFAATVGAGNPPSQTLDITNIGGGTLTWAASNFSGWLSTAPPNGTAPSTVDLNVAIDGLLAGMYTDTITITSPEAINSPQIVIVDLWLEEPAPEGDTIWVGSGSGELGDTVCIPVEFSNTQELGGISLPLIFDSPNVMLSHVSFDSSRVENIAQKPVEIDNQNHTVCIAVIPVTEPLIPAGDGLLASLYFVVTGTAGCPEPVVVTIDTTTIEPGCDFLFVDGDAQAIVPEFYAGEIGIVCPPASFDICGMVFCNGPFPNVPVEAWTSYPDGQMVQMTHTDSAGHFCLVDLPGPACYDIRVYGPGYCPAVVEACVPNAPFLEIVLTELGEPVVTPWVADYWTLNGTVFGAPMQPGDVITAYDPDGVLCGVATVEAAGAFTIHVYGDDSLTVGTDEGAEEGDPITLMWNCDCELMTVNPWTSHGFFQEDFNFECIRCNFVELCRNWTLFSFNVQPADNALTTILGPLDPHYTHVIGSECDYGARTWDRSRPPFLNDLNYLDNEHGYWLKVSPEFQGPFDLEICGLPEAPDKPLALCDNWNLISYLPNEADELGHALGSIDGQYVHVFGVDCVAGIQTWDANRPPFLNDLVCMRPTRGYWVKTTGATTLTYPTSGYACPETAGSARRSYAITGNTVVTPFYADIWSVTPSNVSGLAEGDVLRVFDEDGVLSGEAFVQHNGAFLIHVTGDDPTTKMDEGATNGSVLTFRSEGREFTSLTPVVWQERESMELSLSPVERVLPTEYALLQNYPNPFNPSTRISFRLPTESVVSLEIYNVLGQAVRTVVKDEWMEAGAHGVTWDGLTNDGDEAKSGVYFYRLTAGSFSDVRKMTLLK